MGKLYKVISNEDVEKFGVKVGDICSLKEDHSSGTAWFYNEGWKGDGEWCLEWTMVEELVETN